MQKIIRFHLYLQIALDLRQFTFTADKNSIDIFQKFCVSLQVAITHGQCILENIWTPSNY